MRTRVRIVAVLLLLHAVPVGLADAGLPDLAVRSITPSIASPHAGDVMTFAVVVANLGTAPSGEFHAFLARESSGGNPGYGAGGDAKLGEWIVPSLAPGASQTFVSDPWTAITGPHVFRAIADGQQVVAESSEENNMLDAHVEVLDAAAPDLALASFAVSPIGLAAGENATVTYQTKNTGSADSGAFALRLLVDGAVAANASAASLPAGQTSASQTFLVGPLTEGPHALTLLIDPDDVVAESNESNNAGNVTLSVGPAKLAKLALSCAGPTFPSVHVAYALACTAQNVGGGTVAGLAFEATLDAAASKPGTVDGPLAPSDKVAFTVDWGLLTPGSHQGQVTIQPLDKAGANATISTSFVVPQPGDLVVMATTISPAIPQANETVAIEVKVRNQGYSSIPAGFSLAQLVLDGQAVASMPSGGLVPGQGVTIANWSLSGLAAGEHDLLVRVDPDSAIAEANESNNEKKLILPVSGPAAKPDLAVTLVDADFVTGGGLGVGPSYGVVQKADKPSSVLFRAKVANAGTLATGSFTYAFLVDGGIVAGSNVHPGLLPGESATLVSYPWVAKPGPHKIEAVVDWQGKLPELDEDNNVLAWDLVTPDLVVSDPSWAYETEGKINILNAAMVFTATITNAGPFDAGPFFVRFSMDGNESAPGDTFVQGLAAGASTVVKSYQWKPKAGALQLTVVADPTDGVLESDETDNTASAQITLPDLVPKAIYWSPEQVAGYADPVPRFNFSVANDGAIGTSTFAVQLHIDGAPYAKPLIGPLLDAGESAKVEGFFVTSLAPGSHTLKVTLDDPATILESDESNNGIERKFTWPAKPGEGEVPLDPAYALSKTPAPGMGALLVAILSAFAIGARGRGRQPR